MQTSIKLFPICSRNCESLNIYRLSKRWFSRHTKAFYVDKKVMNVRTMKKADVLGLSCLVMATIVLLQISAVPQVAASSQIYTPRDSICINGNDNFTPSNGASSGSGIASDPYIIENWVIDASGAHGIWIENTTKYFVIRNCLIENGGGPHYGIYLENVNNGKIENNTCENNSTGVYLDSSSNNALSSNTCENNSNWGIHLYSSSSNTLSNNNCSGNRYGICLSSSSNHNTLSSNTCENNDDWGIYLVESSSYNSITNNTCYGNGIGDIYQDSSSTDNVLSNNTTSTTTTTPTTTTTAPPTSTTSTTTPTTTTTTPPAEAPWVWIGVVVVVIVIIAVIVLVLRRGK